MANALLLVDPITFKITKTEDPNPWETHTKRFLERVKQNVLPRLSGKSTLEMLEIINDTIVEFLNSDDCEWGRIPSDTRFPGFFSSIADHALATSAAGVVIAVELFNNKVDLAVEYGDSEMAELLGKREGVIEVVRTLCLLHDLGKPSTNHVEKTREAVENFLSSLGIGALASDMAEAAMRHHYGSKAKYPPSTKVEWIVAYADKFAVHDRAFTGKILERAGKPLEWLGAHVDPQNRKIISDLVNIIEKIRKSVDLASEEAETAKIILPYDYDFLRNTLDAELFRMNERFGVDVRIALLLVEGAGIQGYVTKSSSARHLVGRSSLVEVATHLAKEELEEMLAPEVVIYATSGSMFALVPPSELSTIVKKLNEKFADTVKGGMKLKSCANSNEISFTPFELKTGPPYTWFKWEEKISLSKIGRRNFGEFYTILNNRISVLDERVNESAAAIPVSELCSICFEERALPEDHPEVVGVRGKLPEDEREGYRPGEICLNVDRHRMNVKTGLETLFAIKFDGAASIEASTETPSSEVSNSPLYKIVEAIKRILPERLNKRKDLIEEFSNHTVIFHSVKSWNILGRQSMYALNREAPSPGEEDAGKGEIFDVAFIKGDGDNFGLIKSAMSNLTFYREVSRIFEDVIQRSLALALSEVIIHQLLLYTDKYAASSAKSKEKPRYLKLPFDILYFGGDDFMLVLDAGFVFTFLKAFRDAIVKRLGPRKKEYEKLDDSNLSIFPLGVSLGVVVAPNRAPIHGTLEALTTLCEEAKEKSKRFQKSTDRGSVYGGEVCVSLERFTTIPSKEFAKEAHAQAIVGSTKICRTSWPLLGSELFPENTPTTDSYPLLRLVEELLNCGLRSNNIAMFADVYMPKDDVELRIRYRATHMEKNSPQRKGYVLLADNLTVTEDDCVKFRNRDAANIMKIIHDDKRLLPMD